MTLWFKVSSPPPSIIYIHSGVGLLGNDGARAMVWEHKWNNPEMLFTLTSLIIMVQRVWSQLKMMFLCPHHICIQNSQTTLIITSVKVYPPLASITKTLSTFTEWQMVFVGSHHIPQILESKGKTNHESDFDWATNKIEFTTKHIYGSKIVVLFLCLNDLKQFGGKASGLVCWCMIK